MSGQLTSTAVATYRVIFGDTDAGGIVYHARYLEMAERGRNEVMRCFGLDIGYLFKQLNIGLALRSADMKFHEPALFDDFLTIHTHLKKLGAAGSIWVSDIRRGTLICTVCADVFCMDCVSKKPITYPEDVLLAFERIRLGGADRREWASA